MGELTRFLIVSDSVQIILTTPAANEVSPGTEISQQASARNNTMQKVVVFFA